MPNQYWEKRMQEIEGRSHKIGMDYARYTERQFNVATSAIDKKISYWYQKMVDNNGVSLAAAKEMLRKDELEEFHWTVEEYIKKGESLEYDKRWENQLINASAKVHISRLEAMKLQMQQECEVLYGNLSDGMDKTMTEIYTQGYYHTAYELMKGTKLGTTVVYLDTRRIEKAVQTAWANDGKNFTARCWDNKNRLINELNTILTQNIIRGEAPGKAIDQLAKKMKVSRYNAGRLIMTESAFISSKCQSDCYKDLGVEKFEFVATLDGRTSEICRSMDGQVFKLSDYKIGLNAPPLHCFCRSCTVPYFEDDYGQIGERAARGEDGKTTYVPGDMTYEEWEKKFIKIENKNTVENNEENSKIKLGDIIIHKSVGSKTKNYDVFIPDTGEIYHFVEGTKIQNGEVFAGKGTKHPLHEGVAEGLTEQFGGTPEKWQHCKGHGFLDVDGEERKAEVHWFQEETVGKVRFKVKRWEDED